MKHTPEERLKVAEVLARKIIAFENKCRNQEFEDDAIKCHELSDAAAMARMVTSDTGDVGEGC